MAKSNRDRISEIMDLLRQGLSRLFYVNINRPSARRMRERSTARSPLIGLSCHAQLLRMMRR